MTKKRVRNKLGMAFGPIGTVAGIPIFLAGIYGLFYSPLSIIILLLGAFVSFTYTASVWDIEQKKISTTHFIFGIIPIYKWITVNADSSLKIKNKSGNYVAYSSCNRSLYYPDDSFELVLIQQKMKWVLAKTSDVDGIKEKHQLFISYFNMETT